jgi:hypothetical protein
MGYPSFFEHAKKILFINGITKDELPVLLKKKLKR